MFVAEGARDALVADGPASYGGDPNPVVEAGLALGLDLDAIIDHVRAYSADTTAVRTTHDHPDPPSPTPTGVMLGFARRLLTLGESTVTALVGPPTARARRRSCRSSAACWSPPGTIFIDAAQASADDLFADWIMASSSRDPRRCPCNYPDPIRPSASHLGRAAFRPLRPALRSAGPLLESSPHGAVVTGDCPGIGCTPSPSSEIQAPPDVPTRAPSTRTLALAGSAWKERLQRRLLVSSHISELEKVAEDVTVFEERRAPRS